MVDSISAKQRGTFGFVGVRGFRRGWCRQLRVARLVAWRAWLDVRLGGSANHWFEGGLCSPSLSLVYLFVVLPSLCVSEGLLSRGVVACGWRMEAWLVDFLSVLLAGMKLGGDEDGSGDEEC